MKYEWLKKIIDESEYLVCLSGKSLATECGIQSLREGEKVYDIEMEYGYSPEEIISSTFYNTRQELFFHFYKDVILKSIVEPAEPYKALAALEAQNKVNGIITKSFYSLEREAGCKNVVELHGSVYQYECKHCGTQYPIEYIIQSHKVPLCSKCNATVRPGIRLYGEMIDNQLMTKAANMVSKADVLLILGANLRTKLCELLLPYFYGKHLILINKEDHFADKMADGVIHDDVKNVLPEMVD